MSATPQPRVVVNRVAYGRMFALMCGGAALIAAAAFTGTQYLLTRDGGSGRTGLIIAVVLAQLALAAAWAWGTRSPDRIGTAVVVAVVAAAADVSVLTKSTLHTGILAKVVAFSVLLAFAHQLIRRLPRAHVLRAVAADVTGSVLVSAISVLLTLRLVGQPRATGAALIAIGTAVVVSHLCDGAVPVPRLAYNVNRGGIGIVLGAAAAGAAVTWWIGVGTLSDGLQHAMVGGAIGLAATLASVAVTTATVDRTPSRWSALTLHAVVPYALAAPAALVITLAVSL